MFFIDESGSIPKVCDGRYKNKFFVIGFIHTDNPRKLKSTYKRAISKLMKDFPDFFANLDNPKELKGSEALPFMKLFIFEKLLRATDIKIGHIVVDTTAIEDRFRTNPARSFNYLINLVMKNFPFCVSDTKQLVLKIDNRNSAVKSLNELEGYLHGTLVLEEGKTNNVDVEYIQSENSINIQVADMITNTIYQKYRYDGMPFPNFSDIDQNTNKIYDETFKYLYDFLSDRICIPFEFPIQSETYEEVASN